MRGGNSVPDRAMNLEVLGCAGGIGGRERLTTCLRVDDDVLLDAGTGLATLHIEQLAKIDHVFLSHSHLDHVAGLALLVDAVLGKRSYPITLHATQKVIDALKTHLFNWTLWPDFTKIPNESNPVLQMQPIEHAVTLELGGRRITPYPVNHTVDAVGYWVRNGVDGFVFSGDMFSTPELWRTLARKKKLSKVIVDCSFPNAESDLATLSKHFCPQSLLEDIGAMAPSIEFLIYHLKPGQEDLIIEELRSAGRGRLFSAIKSGDRFIF